MQVPDITAVHKTLSHTVDLAYKAAIRTQITHQNKQGQPKFQDDLNLGINQKYHRYSARMAIDYVLGG